MKNKFILFLSILLVFSTITAVAEGDGKGDVPPQPNPQQFSAKARIDGDSYIEVEPGQTGVISALVTVTTERDNYQPIIVSGNATASDTTSIYLENSYDEMTANTYGPYRNNGYYGPRDRFENSNYKEDTVGLTFRIKVPDTARAGSYPVTVNVFVDGASAGQFSSTVRVKSNGKAAFSKLDLSEVTVFPNPHDVSPGQMVVATVNVKNNTEYPVYNAEVKLEGMDKDGFTLLRDFNARTIETLNPGQERSFAFELGSAKNIKPGNYEFKVTLTYPNAAKEGDSSNERSFFLTVGSNPDKASALIIENLNVPSKTLYPGNQAKISFDVTNKGQSVAERVYIKSSVDGSGLVSRSVGQFFEEKINPGESKHYEFTYFATPASTTQNYPISFKVEYNDSYTNKEEPIVTEQVAGIFVSNPQKDDEGKDKKPSTPKLIIEKYSFEPRLPEAGNEFEMTLNFQNTNSKHEIRNIKITLSSMETTSDNSNTAGSNIFTPVDSSNTFFIDSIKPGQMVEKKIKMYTVPDAKAKTYQVTANFEYEDTQNNEYKASENIGIPVIQKSRLEIGEVQTQESFNAGDGAPLSVVFYNTGKVTLYNMMVRAESDDPSVEIQNPNYYIGNFVSGSTESHDCQINSFEPGTKKVKLIFSYEDSTGTKQEEVKEITYEVSEAPQFDPNEMGPDGMYPDGMGPGMEEEGFMGKVKNLAKKWYFWTILAAIAIAVIVIIRRSHHKKRDKELTLDE